MAACTLALGACGSTQAVDSGGFTVSQRTAAQAALDRLQATGIPRAVVAISYQSGQAPITCIVLPDAGLEGRFKLVVAWKPDRAAYISVPQSVLEATIGGAAGDVRYHVTTFGGGGRNPTPEPPSVAATLVRAALAKPSERCEVLENSHLRLVAAPSVAAAP